MSKPTNTAQPRGSGLSLYANLLDPTASTPGSIAKGPVVFKNNTDTQEEALVKKPQIDAGKIAFIICYLRAILS